jgi:flagellar assembly protein FliH
MHGGASVMSKETFGAYEGAKDILAQAEKEAERIRQEAEQQRSETIRQGYEEGYQKGYTEALTKVAEIETEFQALRKRLEPQLVQLSVTVAEKIIGEELKLRPDAMLDIVGQALRTVRHQRDIVIRVHPSQVDAIEERKQTLFGILSRAREVRVVGDETLRELGCVIETEVGILNADVTTQLDELRKALEGVK